jgi:hypothetical protein
VILVEVGESPDFSAIKTYIPACALNPETACPLSIARCLKNALAHQNTVTERLPLSWDSLLGDTSQQHDAPLVLRHSAGCSQ